MVCKSVQGLIRNWNNVVLDWIRDLFIATKNSIPLWDLSAVFCYFMIVFYS